MDDVVDALSKINALEELYEVTGELTSLLLFSALDIESFREVLNNRIMKINGVKGAVTHCFEYL